MLYINVYQSFDDEDNLFCTESEGIKTVKSALESMHELFSGYNMAYEEPEFTVADDKYRYLYTVVCDPKKPDLVSKCNLLSKFCDEINDWIEEAYADRALEPYSYEQESHDEDIRKGLV